MTIPKHLLLLHFLTLGFHPLFSQGTPTTGLMIEDSKTLGEGTLELAGAYSDRVLAGSYGLIIVAPDGLSERSQTLSVGAAYGIADGIDVMSELQWCTEYCPGGQPERVTGFGDLRLGLKFRMWESPANWSLSWVPMLAVPLSATGQASTRIPAGTDQLLVLSGTSGRAASTIQAGVHYGYAESPDPNLHLHLAAGFGYQVTEALQPRFELHFENAPFDRVESIIASTMAGLVWQLDERVRLDLGLHAIASGESAWDERTFLLRFIFAP